MSEEQEHPVLHQAEREQAAAQVGAIDMVSGATGVAQFLPFGWKVPRVFGKTNFETLVDAFVLAVEALGLGEAARAAERGR